MSSTLLELDERLLQKIGYWKYRHAVTTALAASNSVVSTNLQNHRSTADTFNDWYIVIEDYQNAGVSRKISDDDGTSELTALGTAWTSDSANKATFRLCPFNWDNRVLAIRYAIREIFPNLKQYVDNRTLITGNVLPNAHFDDQSTSGTPDNYAFSNSTGTAETTIIRGGARSIKVTASAANGYMYVTSSTWKGLLDLQGSSITFRCWVYSEVADDAYIVIYTASNDGTTTQTLTSTTTCAAGKWTLLELENQSLNDDLHEIQFRFKVKTNGSYAIFDNARAISSCVDEYLLPSDFDEGTLKRVSLQTSSRQDYAADDLQPEFNLTIHDSDIISDGTNNYLKLPYQPTGYQVRLEGYKPLSDPTLYTSTVEIDDEKQLNLLAEYAAYLLYDMESNTTSTLDKSTLELLAAKHYNKYVMLKGQHSMNRIRTPMRIRGA